MSEGSNQSPLRCFIVFFDPKFIGELLIPYGALVLTVCALRQNTRMTKFCGVVIDIPLMLKVASVLFAGTAIQVVSFAYNRMSLPPPLNSPQLPEGPWTFPPNSSLCGQS